MGWFTLGLAWAACPPLELRQEVGTDPTWLSGDVATVWADGKLWWLDPTGLRSTPAPPGEGRPLGRLGKEVVWGKLRDDFSSYAVTGRSLPFAVIDWQAVGDGALVRSAEEERFSAHRIGADGAAVELTMPAIAGGADGLSEWMREACAKAMPAGLRAGTPQVLATACTLPAQAFLVGLDGTAKPLPPLTGRQELGRVAGTEKLAAVVMEQAEFGTTARLAWGTTKGWTIDPTALPHDQLLDLVVADGLRFTLATHEGRHVVRCEQDEVSITGAPAVWGAPLHGSPGWGLATLVKVDDRWWIASTRAPQAK